MNKKLKRSVSAALICAVLLTSTATALNVTAFADNTSVSTTADKTNSYTVKSKKVTKYVTDTSNKSSARLYFVNGTDIPYMELGDLIKVQCDLISEDFPDFKVRMKAKGDKVTLTRENKYTCEIDFSKDTIYFVDYNAFINFDPERALIDMAGSLVKDEDGNPLYLKRIKDSNNERYGSDITFDLGAYNVDLVRCGDKYLLPIQTFSDVFFYDIGVSVMYNGKTLFVGNCTDLYSSGELKPLGKLYFKESVKKDKISKELAEFNYNEFCFALDTHYGLKDIHKIDTFDALMTNSGLKQMMLSGDAKQMDVATYYLATRYLDDNHTVYGLPSPATGFDLRKKLLDAGGEGPTRAAYSALKAEFRAAREKFYPDGVPAYEEVGDTAFITFDSFAPIPAGVDYYETAPTADATDTMGIIAYSVQRILRKDSPVKNVVLDLSCNGGGAAETAIYTIAAFLGKTDLSVEDSFTGALITSSYSVDTNFDKKFNSKDTLADKGLNLFCLESGISFSCGNLVPNMFKQSSDVSLIGETSAGGACTVQWMTTATGASIRISSPNRLSFIKNGSFYDVDRGADPDIYLTKKESYYDRKKLVEFIDSLL